MMTWLKSKTTTQLPIGLDIGESGIRLVQLRQDGSQYTVHCAALWERSCVQEIREGEAPAERIAQFVRQSGFNGRRTVAGLSSPEVELHPLDLPLTRDQVHEQHLCKAIDWEIHRLTTLDKDSLQTSMWPLPRSKRAKATYMGVAAPRSKVNERLAACDDGGLTCIRVDVAPCALSGLTWLLRNAPANQVWGILDLGNYYTRLIMCVDEYPVLVRSFRIGGRNWTEAAASTLKVSLETAERHKRDFGLAQPAAPKAGGPSAHPELMTAILREDLQRLALESERSYEYVLQCYAPRIPGDLVLVGGGAQLRGLTDYLSSKLGIQVYNISRCQSAQTTRLVSELAGAGSLEACALACGYSLQGAAVDAWR